MVSQKKGKMLSCFSILYVAEDFVDDDGITKTTTCANN